ncbi:MAG: chorismate synthase, partial [Acidobacteriota bacterium]
TLVNPLPSVDLDTGQMVQAHYVRSVVCQVPPGGVIGEAMVAIVLANSMREKFGGDSLKEMKRNYEGYCQQIKEY